MRFDNYETSDFTLAVTLLALGFNITNFDLTNPRRTVFIFENPGSLEDSVEMFWDNKLLVNPKVLLGAQRELKSRMNQLIG